MAALERIQGELAHQGERVDRLTQVEQVAVAAHLRGSTTIQEIVEAAVNGALRAQETHRSGDADPADDQTRLAAAAVAETPRRRRNVRRLCAAACAVTCLATAGVSYLAWGVDSATRHDVPTAAMPLPVPQPPPAGTAKQGETDGPARDKDKDAKPELSPPTNTPTRGPRVLELPVPPPPRLTDDDIPAGAPATVQMQAPAGVVGSGCGPLRVDLRRLTLCRRIAAG
jgi:hypothetical protein